MKIKLKLLLLILLIATQIIAQKKAAHSLNSLTLSKIDDEKSINKKEQDRIAIKAMCGIYKVNFDFVETFSPDTAYKYHKRYSEWGIEYVFIAAEDENKIALQHILIVNDSIVIKHWRQDWLFENKSVYQYYKDNEWLKKTLTTEQATGTWTQKVYQVDDSPRYESYGTWVHVDGKHYWEGTNDSPLPRREFTKRNDYNVMRRHSRIEIFGDGWALLQDNEKILRSNGIDKVLCWEKGIEKFSKGNYDASPALKWWREQTGFWADVRKAWEDVYKDYQDLKLEKKVNNKSLYEALFELGDNACKHKIYNKGTASSEIKKVIATYIKA
jgi:hypothetical protein